MGRQKLERENEENMQLQNKINEKNEELEGCNNKIGELVEELNQNEEDLYEYKQKIKHLNALLNQYQGNYPLFKPQSVTAPNNSLSSRHNSFIHQTNLLEDLLCLHQKMEAKITAIKRHTITTDQALENLHESKEFIQKSAQNKSALIYESADEKLDEWDLDIISPRVSAIKCFENNGDTKQLKQDLKELSQNENKLKKDLSAKLKEDALSTCGWFTCFFRPKANIIDTTSDLIEEYLKMQTQKTMTNKKYKRKVEKERAKAVRMKMGISK